MTADVSQMTEHQHLLAAHCDPKGKMWSNLRLFRRQDGFAFIERRSLRDAQLKELKNTRSFPKSPLPQTTNMSCWVWPASVRVRR